jgi:inosine/xanthosine triphosphate pyrophosphatase family protein
MVTIAFATSNEHKIREVRQMIDPQLRIIGLREASRNKGYPGRKCNTESSYTS